MSRLLLTCLFLFALLQIPATPPEQPGNNTSASPVAPIAPDPAAVTFKSDTGLLLVAVKPDKTADYEAVITALQEQLATTTDPAKRALAEGWKVYKATEVDAKAAAIYVHVMLPTVIDSDYRPSLLLDELLSGAPPELLAKYRDAFAAPPAKLALAEIAHMSVVPVPKPTNASPDAPKTPGKPGNVSAPAPKPGAAPKPSNTTPSGVAKPPPAPGNVSPPAPVKPESASPTAPVKPGNVSPTAPTKPGNVSPPAPAPPALKKPPGRRN